MARTLARVLVSTAFALCAGTDVHAVDAPSPAFTMPSPAPCLDAAVRVQAHSILRTSLSAATSRIGKDFHVPDWHPGLPLYDRTLEQVYGKMLADPELSARFARVSGETYIRSIIERGTAEQQQSFGRWLHDSDIGRRYWTLVVDEGLCAGLLNTLAQDPYVSSPGDRQAVRDWQARAKADRVLWRDEDTNTPEFQEYGRLWITLMRRAPFDRDGVWGRVLETHDGEEEPILKAMRPALMPLMPEIAAAGQAASAATSASR